MVLRTCQAIIHDFHVAEDAAQATFLALARRADSVGHRGTVAGWLYRVARRISLRVAGRHRPVCVASVQDLNLISTRIHASDSVASQELWRLLHDELDRLPDKLRVPLLLCFFEGLTQAEAARRLGWPIGTIATCVARGRERLHHRLIRRGITAPAAGIAAFVAVDSATAVSPSFAGATARAGVEFAIGGALPEVSNQVVSLAKGAIRAMTIQKMQWAASVLITCAAVTLGTGLAIGQRTGAGNPAATRNETDAPQNSQPGAKPADATADRQAGARQRRRSLNNLKQIMLAILNYEAANGYLPADVCDKDGKPLLSWRVLVLPYLEQMQLYNQFKLDEAWDSEHNIKLLAMMPDIYRVGFEPKDSSHTYYQVFAGPGTPLHPVKENRPNANAGSGGGAPAVTGAGGGAPARPGLGLGTAPPGPDDGRRRIRFADIVDGASNTLGVVEAGPPVPWSKPADIPFDPKKPLPKLAGPFGNVLLVAFMDGSAHAFRRNIEDKTLRLLIHMNSGVPRPSLNEFHAEMPAETPEEKEELRKLIEENERLVGEIETLMKEHAALMTLEAHLQKDAGIAEDQQRRFKQIIEELQAKNKQMRDNFGLRQGARVPKPSELDR
jgi:RNA polymerase sigma factor (sigma-70 family)